MQSFDEAVGLGVIWRGHEMLHAPYLDELLEGVRGDGGRHSKCLNPTVAEGVEDRLGCDVCHGNGDWPAGEPIYSGQ